MRNLGYKAKKGGLLTRKAENERLNEAADIWASIFTDLIDEKQAENKEKLPTPSPLTLIGNSDIINKG